MSRWEYFWYLPPRPKPVKDSIKTKSPGRERRQNLVVDTVDWGIGIISHGRTSWAWPQLWSARAGDVD